MSKEIVEKHDDLVDVFTIVLHMVIEKDRTRVRVLTREQAAIIRYGSIRDFIRYLRCGSTRTIISYGRRKYC